MEFKISIPEHIIEECCEHHCVSCPVLPVVSVMSSWLNMFLGICQTDVIVKDWGPQEWWPDTTEPRNAEGLC